MNISNQFVPLFKNETNWNVTYLTNLTNTLLEEANLTNSNLEEANLTNQTFENVNQMENILELPETDLPPWVIYSLIIIGTIGNGLVCLAILLDRKLQNPTNYFLCSLAVTDLLVSLVVLPSRMASVVYILQPSLFPWCFLQLVTDDYITFASAIHICFISLGRYFAIRDPLSKKNLIHRKVGWKIGLVWFISFVAVIPYLILAIISEQKNEPQYCVQLLGNLKPYKLILYSEALVMIIMMIIVITSFILTSNILRNLAKKQQENALEGSTGLARTVGGKQIDIKKKKGKIPQSLQSEQKALRVVWLVSFAFIISMGPYAFLNLFYIYAPPDAIIPGVVTNIVGYLAYANSVINPIIYTIFSGTFRKDFKHLIQFKYKKLL